jgi:hypothetical protein
MRCKGKFASVGSDNFHLIRASLAEAISFPAHASSSYHHKGHTAKPTDPPFRNSLATVRLDLFDAFVLEKAV